jgi:hypothetical protein
MNNGTSKSGIPPSGDGPRGGAGEVVGCASYSGSRRLDTALHEFDRVMNLSPELQDYIDGRRTEFRLLIGLDTTDYSPREGIC